MGVDSTAYELKILQVTQRHLRLFKITPECRGTRRASVAAAIRPSFYAVTYPDVSQTNLQSLELAASSE